MFCSSIKESILFNSLNIIKLIKLNRHFIFLFVLTYEIYEYGRENDDVSIKLIIEHKELCNYIDFLMKVCVLNLNFIF